MISDLRKDAQHALDDMKWFLVDVDEEEKAVQGVVGRFANSAEGNACVIVGRPESGRTTVVKEAVEHFGVNVPLKIISIAQLGSEKNTLRALTDDKDIKSCVLVIEDADELAARQRQTLLYLLLDTTRKGCEYQWLVFLMVQNQSFITSLEKRVRSRLPMARIIFQPAATLEDYTNAFIKLMGKESPDSSEEWIKFVMETSEDPSVSAELKYLFSADNSYAVLKKVTSAFLCLYMAKDPNRSVAEIFTEAVEMLLPRKHSLETIVKSLPIWSLCVLMCVYRRLRTCPVSATLGYRKVAQDLRLIGNTVDSRVRVTSDLAVFKELDQLVEYGLLVADSKANNAVFRRCSLNMHSKTLDEILRGITLPVAIGYWYDTQAPQ